MLSKADNDILQERYDNLTVITLNRVAKYNAFDSLFLTELQRAVDAANADPKTKVIVLKAEGEYFSAGADLNWMQRVVELDEKENQKDAMVLAQCMYSLYHSPKPTMALVQGPAFGGGLGLIAACDIAMASLRANFCFSEVKLGLVPAVISPYVVKAIGERAACHLFMSAEVFDAEKALSLNLVQFAKPADELWPFGLQYAKKLAALPPGALQECKALARKVAARPIDASLMEETAAIIAKKRISKEGQEGILAFLSRRNTHV